MNTTTTTETTTKMMANSTPAIIYIIFSLPGSSVLAPDTEIQQNIQHVSRWTDSHCWPLQTALYKLMATEF